MKTASGTEHFRIAIKRLKNDAEPANPADRNAPADFCVTLKMYQRSP